MWDFLATLVKLSFIFGRHSKGLFLSSVGSTCRISLLILWVVDNLLLVEHGVCWLLLMHVVVVLHAIACRLMIEAVL